MSTVFDLVALVERVIAELSPGQFLTLDYSDGPPGLEPYAQLAVDGDSYYLEVVSELHLPPTQWPLYSSILRAAGWSAPDDDTANWWQTATDPHLAARALVDALMTGRGCTAPDRFSVSIGTFPAPPDGGEPLPGTRGSGLAA